MLKKITALIMSIIMLFTVCVPAFAADAPGAYGVNKSVQVFQKTFSVGSEEARIIENAVTHNTTGQEGKYTVGSAFVVYNLDANTTFYMIPVFSNQECIGMVHMSQDLDVGVTYTSDTMLYSKIFDLPAGNYILYVAGGVLYAESSNGIVLLQDMGLSLPSKDKHLTISYDEKMEIFLSQSGNECALSDVCTLQDKAIDIAVENESRSSAAQPCVEIPVAVHKSCNITDFVSQGNYYLCWAACIATISNYKKSTKLTAISVANKFGVNYTSSSYRGETVGMINNALNSYGFSYSTKGRLSWSNFKTNIDNDNPFILVATVKIGNVDCGHAITAYGYSCAYNDSADMSDQRYVIYWNPGVSEYPQKYSFQYDKSQFVYGGYTYDWSASIAP